MNFADAILAAEQVSKAPKGSITAPQKVRAAALVGFGADEKRLVLEAFNPYRVFGVKKWDEPKQYAANDISFYHFFNVLDLLADRQLTGNAARSAVTEVLGRYTKKTAGILVRVIKKDLKCGADKKTFENIYPDFWVPSFDVMLAGKIQNYKTYNFTWPSLVETKYDGMRLVAMVENGVIEYLSRSGKPSDYCEGQFDEELIKLEKEVGQPIVVDGECLAVGGDGFADTTRAKGSKNVDIKATLKFFAFDLMTLKGWKARNYSINQSARSRALEDLIKHLGLKRIVKSTYKICNNLQELLNFYAEVCDKGLPGQDEGLIIKNPSGYYEWDRSSNWMKLKPVIDVDLKIVGCYEGTEGTKNEGKLGGFYVAGFDENKNKIKSHVGGFKVNSKKFIAWFPKWAKENNVDLRTMRGFGGDISKDQFFRAFAWRNQDMFVGQVAMMEAQELTLAQDSDTYALRFAQFIMLRDDK